MELGFGEENKYLKLVFWADEKLLNRLEPKSDYNSAIVQSIVVFGNGTIYYRGVKTEKYIITKRELSNTYEKFVLRFLSEGLTLDNIPFPTPAQTKIAQAIIEKMYKEYELCN